MNGVAKLRRECCSSEKGLSTAQGDTGAVDSNVRPLGHRSDDSGFVASAARHIRPRGLPLRMWRGRLLYRREGRGRPSAASARREFCCAGLEKWAALQTPLANQQGGHVKMGSLGFRGGFFFSLGDASADLRGRRVGLNLRCLRGHLRAHALARREERGLMGWCATLATSFPRRCPAQCAHSTLALAAGKHPQGRTWVPRPIWQPEPSWRPDAVTPSASDVDFCSCVLIPLIPSCPGYSSLLGLGPLRPSCSTKTDGLVSATLRYDAYNTSPQWDKTHRARDLPLFVPKGYVNLSSPLSHDSRRLVDACHLKMSHASGGTHFCGRALMHIIQMHL